MSEFLNPVSLIDAAVDRELMPGKGGYWQFFQEAWPIVEPETAMVKNWHMHYICWRLQKEIERIKAKQPRTKHLIINVPPRSGKSHMSTVMLNAWAWTFHPGLRMMTGSYSSDLATEHAIKTRDVIKSEWYQERWGHTFQFTRDRNTTKNFMNTRRGQRLALATGGGIGKGADIIILDDPLNPHKADSESERKKANTWISKVLHGRLNDREVGLIVIVMQRVHEMDPCGFVLHQAPEDWEIITIPSEDRFPVQPIGLRKFYQHGLMDPVRFPQKVLEESKITMGSRDFAGQHGQQPAALEGNIIKRHWYRRMTAEQFRERFKLVTYDVSFFIDSAYDEDGGKNDPTVVLACTYLQNTLYIIGCSEVWMELPELILHLKSFIARMGYTYRSRVKIEPKASGKSIKQVLVKAGFNVSDHKGPDGKHITDGKIVRTTANTGFLEAGRVVLVDGLCDAWVQKFIDQCATFPGAAHDDMVDTQNMAIEHFDTNHRKRRMH